MIESCKLMETDNPQPRPLIPKSWNMSRPLAVEYAEVSPRPYVPTTASKCPWWTWWTSHVRAVSPPTAKHAAAAALAVTSAESGAKCAELGALTASTAPSSIPSSFPVFPSAIWPTDDSALPAFAAFNATAASAADAFAELLPGELLCLQDRPDAIHSFKVRVTCDTANFLWPVHDGFGSVIVILDHVELPIRVDHRNALGSWKRDLCQCTDHDAMMFQSIIVNGLTLHATAQCSHSQILGMIVLPGIPDIV